MNTHIYKRTHSLTHKCSMLVLNYKHTNMHTHTHTHTESREEEQDTGTSSIPDQAQQQPHSHEQQQQSQEQQQQQQPAGRGGLPDYHQRINVIASKFRMNKDLKPDEGLSNYIGIVPEMRRKQEFQHQLRLAERRLALHQASSSVHVTLEQTLKASLEKYRAE